MFLTEVRYTNYIRLRPEQEEQCLMPQSSRGQEDSPADDHLPADDPERDMAEVRYQRFPGTNRNPQRIHVTFLLS